MARVPVSFENGVRLSPISDARFRAPDVGEGGRSIAGSVMRLGQTVQGAAETEDQIQTIYAEGRAKALDNEYQEFERDILFGDDGYYSKSNADALNARDPTQKAISDKIGELLEKTQDQRERVMLQGVLDRRKQETFNGVARYAQGQARQFAVTQSEARVSNAQENYIRFYKSDPARADAERATIISEVQARADLLGLEDAGVIAAMKDDALSGMHASVVQAEMLGDPASAAAYLEQHRDEIDPAKQIVLDRQLNPLLVDRDARGFADMAQGIGTPGAVETVPGADGKGEGIVLAMPVAGAVRSGYGTRTDPITGDKKVHRGVDIPAPEGAPIGSAGDGTVRFVGNRNDGYGNVVEVDHGNGYVTRYAHMEAATVKKGDRVTRGSSVGRVGSTGRSTGPHLHFEVSKDDGTTYGKRVDPVSVVGTGAAVRAVGSQQGDLQAQIAWSDSYIDDKLADKPPLYRQQVKDATRAEIKRRHGEARAIEAEGERAAWDDALEQVFALQDNFTSITQIKGYQNLPPDRRLQLDGWADANLDARRKSTATDWQFFGELHRIAADNPALLKDIPIDEARRRLGDTEFKEFLDMIKSPPKSGDPKALTFSDILKETKLSLGEAGYSFGEKASESDKASVNSFLRRMNGWAQGWFQQTGRWPTPDEIRRQGDRFLIEGTWKTGSEWWGSTSGRAFEAPQSGLERGFQADVPDDVRKTIRRALGPSATEEDIRKAYIAGKGIDW